MKKLTIEDLKRIRDEVRESLKIREGESPIKIIVHMGTVGIASGAREVLKAFAEETEKRGITNVTLTQAGHLGIDSKCPLVSVIRPGEPRVTYGSITPDQVSRILVDHALGGKIITEWLVSKEEV